MFPPKTFSGNPFANQYDPYGRPVNAPTYGGGRQYQGGYYREDTTEQQYRYGGAASGGRYGYAHDAHAPPPAPIPAPGAEYYGGRAGGYYSGDLAGSRQVQRLDGNAGNSFGFLRYADTSARQRTAPVVNELRWDDGTILSLNHYHHGDHHHHHHQRQVHHFHDLHLMGSADETLDLRGTPEVITNVIGTDAPPQLRLRPDDVGRNAFVDLQFQIANPPAPVGGRPYSPVGAYPPPPTGGVPRFARAASI
eukprot:TRINITY_DN1800_c0_g1_i1.p1 TRINITY_DN1800_c0_g1~~TRINITY_DN1800_c0_g1_i1.p1  ORF type:complete len:250 (-),score=44.78 TRINITY_DN1800_c0_g1_i1:169-918(-)